MIKYLSTFLLSLCCTWACQPRAGAGAADSRETPSPMPSGQVLAQTYCIRCHPVPEPAQLDRATWAQYVLPRMGYMLGIYPDDSTRKALIEAGPAGQKVLASGMFPEQAQISPENWAAIQEFFLSGAPDRLPAPALAKAQPALPLFKPMIPAYRLSPPSSTLVEIQPGQGLIIGDAHTQSLYAFDTRLNLQRVAKTGEGAVSIAYTPSEMLITTMGSFSPTDAPSGYVLALGAKSRKLIAPLQRPVHGIIDDLNQDGLPDMVIAEFAKWTGKLAWWEYTGSAFVPHVLRQGPGAIRSLVRDVNGDQRPDILALFGQGDEGIFLYTQQAQGDFTETPMIRFTPSHGSSFFTLADLNGDGWEDILYTAGDNADYPPLLKPYHGIYGYLNSGNWTFEQGFFYPLPGAYKAVAEDFDQDGDVDIAAISFFPDFSASLPRSFVFLENEGAFQFRTYTFPESADGRWITMDAGDMDQDGDIDLVLGSLAFEVIDGQHWVDRWTAAGVPFILLENRLK